MNLSCYRSPSVERREGGIEGVGLFVVDEVSPDELLALKGGRLMSEDVIRDNLDVVAGSQHQISQDLFLAGITPEEVDSTLIGYNHSCSPNSYIDKHIALRPMRTLRPGEEVTVDYASAFASDTQEFECRCGSPDCRGYIKPSVDSVDPGIQSRYYGHLADFIERPDSYDAPLEPIDPNCPTSSWLTKKAKRIEASIHGLGLLTIEPIKKDELLAVRGGTLVGMVEILERADELQGSEVQVAEEIFLAGFTEQERLATMMGFNHSCDPNAYLFGQIGIFAMKDIPEGTELTVDYGTAYISASQKFKCNCGSANCRGFVDTEIDWQRPELQRMYKGYFADFIARKIAAEA